MGKLVVKVIGCQNLKGSDLLSKADCYVKVNFGSKSFKTRTIDNDENPKYNESFSFFASDAAIEDSIKFELYDAGTFSDDLLGTIYISLKSLHPNVEQKMSLKWEKAAGTLDLSVLPEFSGDAAKQMGVGSHVQGGATSFYAPIDHGYTASAQMEQNLHAQQQQFQQQQQQQQQQMMMGGGASGYGVPQQPQVQQAQYGNPYAQAGAGGYGNPYAQAGAGGYANPYANRTPQMAQQPQPQPTSFGYPGLGAGATANYTMTNNATAAYVNTAGAPPPPQQQSYGYPGAGSPLGSTGGGSLFYGAGTQSYTMNQQQPAQMPHKQFSSGYPG